MFGFDTHTQTRTSGVIIDIGSGSVGIGIFISDIHLPKPEIIWSHREYVLIKDISSTEVPLKEIHTSLVNAFLKLGADGLKKLKETEGAPPIRHVQATVSAPWTYTITKTINFSDETPFEVTPELIEELSLTAQKQALTAVLENEIFQESQLEVIDNQTISVRVNGYLVQNPKKVTSRTVSLAHITAITQKKILSVLEDSQNKILPKASLSTHSFMYMYYDALTHLNPDTSEACLVDVTSEATEIGIVRDGALSHVTDTAFGTFSIAREISALCNIPKDEAYTYMKGGIHFVESKLSKDKMEELHVIVDAYEDKIAALFQITGDTLAIPKTLFLHCEATTEPFFIKCMENAAKKATGMHHTVHPVTSLLFKEGAGGDTALLLSAHHAHRTHIEAADMDT